jgi:hypothetical protein
MTIFSTVRTTLTKVARDNRGGWELTDQHGQVYRTVSYDVSQRARAYARDGSEVEITYKHGWYAKDVTSLRECLEESRAALEG